ncbi:MAG: DUF799 family lipoprotein [Nitrospiraceae bacterium]|nr:DUF799 family lipoprotein [Nitrospiraceae bacterium]
MANLKRIILLAVVVMFAGCGGRAAVYHDKNMDFGSIHTVAIMPFMNLTTDAGAAERVRDVLSDSLLATGAVYVLPSGEVARGLARAGVNSPSEPAPAEVKTFCSFVKADAVITGVIREYGEVRSGNTSSTIISVSLQMMEAQSGRIVWSASATEGGITIWDRLFGGGAEPMNAITQKAVDELIKKLFA